MNEVSPAFPLTNPISSFKLIPSSYNSGTMTGNKQKLSNVIIMVFTLLLCNVYLMLVLLCNQLKLFFPSPPSINTHTKGQTRKSWAWASATQTKSKLNEVNRIEILVVWKWKQVSFFPALAPALSIHSSVLYCVCNMHHQRRKAFYRKFLSINFLPVCRFMLSLLLLLEESGVEGRSSSAHPSFSERMKNIFM